MLNDAIPVQCDWFFYEHDPVTGELIRESGPFRNAIVPSEFGWVAEGIRGMVSPYLVIGDDTADGFVITEAGRWPVSTVIRDGALVRFRTMLLPGEGNGNHQKASIFRNGTGTVGTGTMFNLLKQPFSKTAGTVLTVEARVTVGG